MNKFGKIYVKIVPTKANRDAFSITVMVEHPMESGAVCSQMNLATKIQNWLVLLTDI